MKNVPPLLLADLQKPTTYLAFLWTIEMLNGKLITGTDHDLDVVIPETAPYAGTYYARSNVTGGDIADTSDLAVDNLEVTGAMPTDTVTQILDVTVDEIEAGLLDMAPVTILVCNWKYPEHGVMVLKRGFLGAITRDSDGKYTTEVRGLTQLLSQTIIQTFSVTCNVVKFGDERCKFNVAPLLIDGVVVSSTSRSLFAVTLTQATPLPPYSYVGGTVTFTSGANNGFSREVKLDPNSNNGAIQLWDDFPQVIAAEDTFTLSPGCDRQPATCAKLYNNIANYRGYGVFVPGINAIMAGPSSIPGIYWNENTSGGAPPFGNG